MISACCLIQSLLQEKPQSVISKQEVRAIALYPRIDCFPANLYAGIFFKMISVLAGEVGFPNSSPKQVKMALLLRKEQPNVTQKPCGKEFPNGSRGCTIFSKIKGFVPGILVA